MEDLAQDAWDFLCSCHKVDGDDDAVIVPVGVIAIYRFSPFFIASYLDLSIISLTLRVFS